MIHSDADFSAALNISTPLALQEKVGAVTERNLTLKELCSKVKHYKEGPRKGELEITSLSNLLRNFLSSHVA